MSGPARSVWNKIVSSAKPPSSSRSGSSSKITSTSRSGALRSGSSRASSSRPTSAKPSSSRGLSSSSSPSKPGSIRLSSSRSPASSSARSSSRRVMELERLEIIDLPAISHLEKTSYPPDEAAPSLLLEHRIVMANPYCYIAFATSDRAMIGFVVGTTAPEGTKSMLPEYMKDHYPHGNVLCIHSIVVDHARRRRGLGTEMMKQYLKKIRETTHVKRILLLSKRRLVPFYENLGFEEVGESLIVHGRDKWFEMKMEL